MKNKQDFIERYYPNYSSCSDIARWNDLHLILHKEEGWEQKMEDLGFVRGFDMTRVGVEYDKEDRGIMQKAIEGFLATKSKAVAVMSGGIFQHLITEINLDLHIIDDPDYSDEHDIISLDHKSIDDQEYYVYVEDVVTHDVDAALELHATIDNFSKNRP